MGKQADVLRAQTELSMLINEGVNLLQEKKTAEAMLNSILNRPTDRPLGHVPDIDESGIAFSFDRIKLLALKNRPEIIAMQKNIEMNQAEVEVAEREIKPDFMVRFMYKEMVSSTEDFWSTMVGVNIPIAFWSANKFKGKIEEARINTLKAKKDLRSMENMVLFEVRDAIVKVETQRNLTRLFRSTVIPQAEQTLRSTSASYQTGGTEFLMLIDACRTLLTARLEYHMAVMNLMTGLASLEQATGLSIEDIVLQQGSGN
jgi:outer membrane protein TolC